MKRQQYNTQSQRYLLSQRDETEKFRLELPQYTNNRNFDKPLRDTRAIKTELNENGVNHKVLDTIEKEVSDALDAFKTERMKQANVIDNMRQELKHLTDKPAVRKKSRPVSPLNEPSNAAKTKFNGKYFSNKYETARETPITIKKLQEELDYTKDLLRGKERALANEILTSQRLRQEVELLKGQQANIDSIAEIKERLLNIIHGKVEEEYIDYKGSIIEEAGINDLLENVEKLVEHLIKEREIMEVKYDKLFELHNKLIEVNSKRKIQNDRVGGDEVERLKRELKKVNAQKLYLCGW